MNASPRLAAALACVLAFSIALSLNAIRGAPESGFGAFTDEPGHVVTGLMVRDYLVDPDPAHPVRYAEQYYLHYPKVVIGQWPPVFYGVQGLWTLVLGTSTRSLLALMALLTAGVAALIFGALREPLGAAAAGLFALLFVLAPLVQELSASVMTEMPLALSLFGAALCFGRWIDGRSRWSLAGFAVLAIAAVLTKGNALALALVPPLALVLAGRLELLRSRSLWIVALTVGLACGPWYVKTLEFSAGTWAGGSQPSLSYALEALPFHARTLWGLGGPLLGLLALAGVASAPRRAPGRGRRCAALALLLALLAFHAAIPSSIEARHMVLAAPAWILLAGEGLAFLVERLAPDRRLAGPAAAALVLCSFAVFTFEVPRKDWRGWGATAQQVVAEPAWDETIALVASDAFGEGLFVAGVALAEERPGHIVLRGSKVLCESDWMGSTYADRFGSPDEMQSYLESLPVGLVLFDHSTRPKHWFPYHDTLLALVEGRPETWRPVARRDAVRGGEVFPGALALYELVGHGALPRGELSLDEALGRPLPGR